MLPNKLEERAKNFQRALDLEEVKRKREEGQVELRKLKRSEHIAKKRALAGKVAQPSDGQEGNTDFNLSYIPQALIQLHPSLEDPGVSCAEKLKTLVSVILTSNSNELMLAVESLKKILSDDKSPPLKYVTTLGVVPRLVELLDSPDELLINYAAWCITNISTGTSDIVDVLAENGCLQPLMRLLAHHNAEIVDQAVWALSNYAGDSLQRRDEVVALGTVEAVIKILAKPEARDIVYVRNMTWLLANLVRGLPSPPEPIINRILAIIPYSISSEDTEIVTHSCWILSYVTDDGNEERIDKVLSLGIVSRLLDLLMSPSGSIQRPALRTVGNMLVGNDSQTQTLLHIGLVDKLSILLSTLQKDIKKETIWCLSNIAAGPAEQVHLITQHSCIELLVQATGDADFEVKKEAVWAVANTTHILDQQLLERLLGLNTLERLVRVLEHQESGILLVALEGISRILRAGVVAQDKGSDANELALRFEAMGGTAHLERLQSHTNVKVYEKVVSMMAEFFGLVEVTDENRMETNGVPEGGFQFS